MELKKSVLNKIFIGVFITWIISLFVVYLPISNLISTTFPATLNEYTMTFFVASTGIAFSMALYLGVDKVRSNP